MIIFPAIDLRNGKCVRLSQGDYNREEIFSENPVEIALKWESKGAKYLHLVDLDGALLGKSENIESIKSIVSALNIPVQLGGGIRTKEQVKMLLELGVERVIIGSKAVYDEAFIKELIDKFKEKIVVSIDAKNGYVAAQGWTELTDIKANDLALRLKDFGLRTLVYTDIAKDGMMEGPNFSELKQIQDIKGLDVIASGGITTKSDVLKLKEMKLYGAIIGKALYLETIRLEDVI